MSKSKKRNKKYAGPGAKSTDNSVRVHKVNAVVRNNFQQWLHEKRKVIKWTSITILIVGIVTFLIIQAVIAING
jgi:preprotein translocase subunit Sss1